MICNDNRAVLVQQKDSQRKSAEWDGALLLTRNDPDLAARRAGRISLELMLTS